MGDGGYVRGFKFFIKKGETMTRQDILTVEEISEILEVSRNTIQRKGWRDRTGCPIRKIGKRLYALATEFHRWMRG